jgi:hypothetical protein
MTTTNTTINKSRLFKRAWYLVKECSYSLSYALRTVWKEMKEAIKEITNRLDLSESLLTTQNSISVAWNATAETMAAYYNSSCYKGD